MTYLYDLDAAPMAFWVTKEMMFMNKTKEKQDFRVRRGCRHICSYRSRRL